MYLPPHKDLLIKILLCGHQFLLGFHHLIGQNISYTGKQCSAKEHTLTNQSHNKKITTQLQ